MPVACLELLLSALPVGDIPHNDLDRGPAFEKRPCAPPLDGDRRSIEPDERQFNERGLLPLQVLRDEVPDPVPGFRAEDLNDSIPDDLPRA